MKESDMLVTASLLIHSLGLVNGWVSLLRRLEPKVLVGNGITHISKSVLVNITHLRILSNQGMALPMLALGPGQVAKVNPYFPQARHLALILRCGLLIA